MNSQNTALLSNGALHIPAFIIAGTCLLFPGLISLRSLASDYHVCVRGKKKKIEPMDGMLQPMCPLLYAY